MTPDDDVISRAVEALHKAFERIEEDQRAYGKYDTERCGHYRAGWSDAIDVLESLPAAAPVVTRSDCDHVIQLGFHGAIQCTPEQCPWCHPELQQKTASVTQLTREGLNKTIKRLCAENSTDEFNAFGTFQNGMYALRDALLLAQGERL